MAAYDPGSEILHHIQDVTLVPLHLGRFDLSITKHVAMMWVAGALLLILLRIAVRQSRKPVPHGLHNMFEALVLFIRDDIARKAMHHEGDRYVGYLLTTFCFIFTCNLLGLIPGLATATGNISVTAGLAIVAFFVIQIGGMRQYGVAGHFKNFVPHGVPVWLLPILVPLELMSMFIKPFALCIRLFANMMAGHVVILAFISLIFILGLLGGTWVGFLVSPIAVFFALFVHFLELLVAGLQAYIFTMLTAQFIALSVHPAH